MEKSTNRRLQKICRLCSFLKPIQSLIPIHGSYVEPLMKQLRPFGIYLSVDDGSPTHICRTCAAKLLLIVETLEQFSASEKKFELAGSTGIITLACDDLLLHQILLDNDNNKNRGNQNSSRQSVLTTSQQNDYQIEEGTQNKESNEVPIKMEVTDEENVATGSSATENGYLTIKKDSENTAAQLKNFMNFGETSPQQPVLFIEVNKNKYFQSNQEYEITISDKESSFGSHENDPLNLELRNSCEKCGRIFTSEYFLLKHIENDHPNDNFLPAGNIQTKLYQCKVCSTTIKSAIGYLSHLKMHAARTPGIELSKLKTEAIPTLCHKIVLKESSSKHRNIGLLKKSIVKVFECDICKHSFCKKSQLRLHIATHRKTFFCGSCEVKFESYVEFQEHEKVHIPITTDTYMNKPFRLELSNFKEIQVKNTPRNEVALINKRDPRENEIEGRKNLESEAPDEIFFTESPIKEENDMVCLDRDLMHPNLINQIHGNSGGKMKIISTRTDLWVKNRYHEECENIEENRSTEYSLVTSNKNLKILEEPLEQNSNGKLDDKSKMYMCGDCQAVFQAKSAVTNHISNHHLNDPESRKTFTEQIINGKYECTICKVTFEKKGSYELHVKSHEVSETSYICSICGYKFVSKKNYKSHMGSHIQNIADKKKKWTKTSSKDLTCNICEEQFGTTSMLMTHLKVTHVFECKQCNQEFPTSEHLKIHMRQVHRESKYICNLCGDHFSSRENTYNHMKSHKMEKSVESIHEESDTPLRCKICHSSLKTKYTMKCHMDKHKGVKNAFVCDKCKMKFDKCWKFEEHKKKHDPQVDYDRPYACAVCKSRFLLETALKRHYLRENCTCVTSGKKKPRE